jgi:hypothetical protein
MIFETGLFLGWLLGDATFIIVLLLARWGWIRMRNNNNARSRSTAAEPKDAKWQNYAGTVQGRVPLRRTGTPANIKTDEELSQFILSINPHVEQLAVTGSAHSWTNFWQTVGVVRSAVLLQTRQHDVFRRMNVVTAHNDVDEYWIGSGVTLREMHEWLSAHDLWLPNVPGPSDVTVGGAIAVDAHGSGGGSTLAQACVSLHYVDGAGRIVKRTPEGSPQWRALNCGLGEGAVIVQYCIQFYKRNEFPVVRWTSHVLDGPRDCEPARMRHLLQPSLAEVFGGSEPGEDVPKIITREIAWWPERHRAVVTTVEHWSARRHGPVDSAANVAGRIATEWLLQAQWFPWRACLDEVLGAFSRGMRMALLEWSIRLMPTFVASKRDAHRVLERGPYPTFLECELNVPIEQAEVALGKVALHAHISSVYDMMILLRCTPETAAGLQRPFLLHENKGDRLHISFSLFGGGAAHHDLAHVESAWEALVADLGPVPVRTHWAKMLSRRQLLAEARGKAEEDADRNALLDAEDRVTRATILRGLDPEQRIVGVSAASS